MTSFQERVFRITWKCRRKRGQQRVHSPSAELACAMARKQAARDRNISAKDIEIISVEMFV